MGNLLLKWFDRIFIRSEYPQALMVYVAYATASGILYLGELQHLLVVNVNIIYLRHTIVRIFYHIKFYNLTITYF